ncbi:MAG TPA: hypothetical protein VIX86_26825 [Streptosporangiaceae bacterium]
MAGAALLAVTGLAVAGCGSGPGSGTGSASSSATSPASTSASAAPVSGSFDGTALFPITVGNTWVYKITTVGLVTGTAVDKITNVVPAAGGHQATTVHTFNGATSSETFLFGSDGSITMPLASIGSTTVRVKSGGIVWPSQAVIDSGQPTKSTIVVDANVAGQSRTVAAHVTVRGAGTATVTVPAGTYHATIVQTTLSESIVGITVSIQIRTWLAPGVGQVKSEVRTNDTVVSDEELKSFTKG